MDRGYWTTLALGLSMAFAANVAEATASLRHLLAAREAPSSNAVVEVVRGTIETLAVLDSRTGATIDYYALRREDGSRLALKDLPADQAIDGASVRLEGRRGRERFFVDRGAFDASVTTTRAKSSSERARRYVGTLEILHADDPETHRCEIVFTLKAADGSSVEILLPAVPEIVEPGMAIAIEGIPAREGLAVDAHAVEILALQRAEDKVQAKIAGTTQVLVILIRYADTATEPYTQAQIQGTTFTNTASVANYFRETSFGKHQLAGVVTPWLTARFPRPTTCNYSLVATEAQFLARNAGYNLANYQKYVYVFPSLPGCGWAGLGGGSQAWINQAANSLVIGHELGHTFGLGHASSLDCGASTIGGTCTRSEYGDPYDVMGNSRAAHLNALHKDDLGYFGANEVKVHAGGTAIYQLSPIETPGGATYAVAIAASARRNYWIEYRQPIGFDAALPAGITGGALVHIGFPSDHGCDTCLLDMTPATTTFSDASLPVGQTFIDSTTGLQIAVRARDASTLTVEVTTPGRMTFADVPPSHPAHAAIETLAWHGVTQGCATNPARFCPDDFVTRAEIAVFIERAIRGSTFAFTSTGTRFADVPRMHWAAGQIEQLHIDGITTGCAANPLRYCPDTLITRAEMAPMLLRGRYTASFNPGTATGTPFTDVPRTHWAAAWIERAYQYNITQGCSPTPLRYCPDATVTRAEMALFIVRTFGLAAPP
ncbi:MAG TPA: S-layer homology domain-containing protein [Casimicrobiaceae bacterium]|nr:S-layer homology domain-containing protein [Casimicrobiaceae bacterium]